MLLNPVLQYSQILRAISCVPKRHVADLPLRWCSNLTVSPCFSMTNMTVGCFKNSAVCCLPRLKQRVDSALKRVLVKKQTPKICMAFNSDIQLTPHPVHTMSWIRARQLRPWKSLTLFRSRSCTRTCHFLDDTLDERMCGEIFTWIDGDPKRAWPKGNNEYMLYKSCV